MEGRRSVISLVSGAAFRAFLIVLLVTTPALVEARPDSDTAEVALLIGLFAAAITFIEYASTYPGLVEFRDAPPFNRIRFAALFFTVFLISLVARGAADPMPMVQLLRALGGVLGAALDFPFSPLRLLMMALPGAAEQPYLVRDAAGIAVLVAMLSLAVFAVVMRFMGWPNRGGSFNVWVNLPTVDPAVGGDIVHRLERDAWFNAALGVLVPFLVPAAILLAAGPMGLISPQASQSLVWTVSAWSFLPVSLFMRAAAMARIAQMIRTQRRAEQLAGTRHMQPA